jgi:hypothetical protein
MSAKVAWGESLGSVLVRIAEEAESLLKIFLVAASHELNVGVIE